MHELRREYRDRLAGIEDEVLAMGSRVQDMLGEAMAALATHDAERAAAVVRADDRLDLSHEQLLESVLTTIALQAPVASELRLLLTFLRVTIHLERMGDLCVNLSKTVTVLDPRAQDAELLAQVQEMGGHARRVISRSLEVLARRDVEGARDLPRLDEPLDRLNHGLFERLLRLAASDHGHLDWAMRMVLVARYLERIGDHAVEAGQTICFAVTGQSAGLEARSASR